MVIDERYYDELRKDCNRCWVIVESPTPSTIGYPALAQPYSHEKAIRLMLPHDAAEMYFQMQLTQPGKDHDLCGILADWLREHKEAVVHHNRVVKHTESVSELLLLHALDLLITYLEKTFYSERK